MQWALLVEALMPRPIASENVPAAETEPILNVAEHLRPYHLSNLPVMLGRRHHVPIESI